MLGTMLAAFFLGQYKNRFYKICFALQGKPVESVVSSITYYPPPQSFGRKFLSDISARKSFLSSENLVCLLLVNNNNHDVS